MKLLNVIIREILLYIEFEDIIKTQLYLVDKQFYHNIIQDNELLRRILFNQVALVLDYEKELKYQRLLNQKHDISQSEDINLVKFYEDPDSQLLSILMKLKNTQKLLSVCHRSTGGHEDGQPKVGNIFEAVSGYKNQAYSAEQIYYPNGLYCITGSPYHQVNENLPQLKILVDNLWDSLKSKDICNEGFVVEVDQIRANLEKSTQGDKDIEKALESLQTLFCNKMNRQLTYNDLEYVAHDKSDAARRNFGHLEDHNKIIEYNTKGYDHLIRQNLFIINKVTSMKMIGCCCPAKAFAILVHDTQINCEDHPLALMIKKVYELSGWTHKKPLIDVNTLHGFNEDSDFSTPESSEPDDDLLEYYKEETKEIQQIENNFSEATLTTKIEDSFKSFVTTFEKFSESGLIPKVVNSKDRWMEFDQKFYSKKFDSKHINEEQKFDLTNSGLKENDIKKITELYQDLDSETDFYRLRLAAIGYDLASLKKQYEYSFKQLIAGRFVTILALDIHNVMDVPPNIDFAGILFSGRFVPSILKFSE
ncbi:unnamed protein product [Moneuplotes crassus]|uniref:F-box domain-containing protein n=1 Tax=Euplotes crassus TaxID=5936 RepID=A0AAD2DAN7_EUPCR|nr:unnamed protein product [Moneuplotes crassus]